MTEPVIPSNPFSPVIKASDVSHWQGKIDWSKMARRGISHVWIKATQGINWVDPRYFENVAGATSEGITVAPYHYYEPARPGIEQANFFCKTAKLGDSGHLGDFESTTGISSSYPGEVQKFLVQTEILTGGRPDIYTRASYWKLYLNGASAWANIYRLLIAHYKDFSGPSICLPWNPMEWYAWQFTEKLDGKGHGCESYGLDGDVIQGDVTVLPAREPALLVEYHSILEMTGARIELPTLKDYRFELFYQFRKNYRRN